MIVRARVLTLAAVALAGAAGAMALGDSPAGGGCGEARAQAGGLEGRLNCRTACQAGATLPAVAASPSGRGLRLRFRSRGGARVRVAVYRLTRGRRVVPNRLVASFGRRSRPFRWSGRARGRPVAPGYYEARFRVGRDVRLAGLLRRGGRFRRLPAFQRTRSCDGLSAYRLGGPAFGGSGRQPLAVLYRLSAPGRVGIEIKRGRRTIRRIAVRSRAPGRTYRVRLRTRTRGNVRVVLTARLGRRTVRSTLTARGL